MWEVKRLGDVAALKNGYAFKSSKYSDNGAYKVVTIANVQAGHMSIEDMQRISPLPSDLQTHQKLSAGDILISMTGNVGRICYVLIDDCLLNQRVGKLVPTKIDKEFFYHSIQNGNFQTAMQERAKGGAQGNLSAKDILQHVIYYPNNKHEQQKIAHCLSSLDEVIGLQAKKVQALKQHKKGLMQQLFPAEGETTPRLRFPEFREAGAWEVKELSAALAYAQPTPFIVSTEQYGTSGTPVLTAGKTFILGHTSEDFGIYERVPVIIFDDFTTEAKFVDFPFKVKSSAIKILSPRPGYSLKFVLEAIISIQFDASQHKRHWIGEFQHLKIPFPPPKEQQKIAHCLSSLDEVIGLESHKLDALKNLKKGLMQQLFPQEVA